MSTDIIRSNLSSCFVRHLTLIPQSMLLLFCQLLTSIHIMNFYCHCANTALISGGTCFVDRLSNGNCMRPIPEITTKEACCEKNGYYLNRFLTQKEYLRDHLMLEVGTRNCVEACAEVYQPTCQGYFCPESHICQLVDGRPTCLCNAQCLPEDYLTGPLCTTDFQRFSNRCLYKMSLCSSQNLGLDVIPCPKRQQSCAEITKPHSTKPLSIPRRDGNHTQSFTIPLIKDQNIRWMDGKRPNEVISTKSEKIIDAVNGGRTDKGLTCPTGERCMLRQFDGLAHCVPMISSMYDTVKDQCRTTRGPFCATDNRTYDDACDLRRAGVRRQMEIRIAYEGNCRAFAKCDNVRCTKPNMVCRPHHKTHQPVCLDCSNLPQDCNALVQYANETPHKRSAVHTFSVYTEGDPVWTGDTNTSGWPTVCGSNHKTYGNTCFLHVINCLSDEFVELVQANHCVDPV